MKAVTAIIADDEEILQKALAAALGKLWPELDICGFAENGIQALGMMEKMRPHMAFLDIKMPGMTGIEAAKKAPASVLPVFVTAYDQFAVEAFESEAVDYVLKPVNADRLTQTVSRLKRRLGAQGSDAGDTARIQRILRALEQQSPCPRLRLIKVKSGDELRLVPVSEVLFFKAEDKYTVVRTRDKEFLIRTPVKVLESQLDPDLFWRVHRGAIVNIEQIFSVKRSFTHQLRVCFKGVDDTIAVSRTHAHLFSHM